MIFRHQSEAEMAEDRWTLKGLAQPRTYRVTVGNRNEVKIPEVTIF